MIKIRQFKKRLILIIFTVLVGGMTHAQLNKSVGDRFEFIHPGILHDQAELDFTKQKIQAEEEPWFSGWKTLMEAADISDIDWHSNYTLEAIQKNRPEKWHIQHASWEPSYMRVCQ